MSYKQIKKDIVALVEEEIRLHRNGELKVFTSSHQLAKDHKICRDTVLEYMKEKISTDDRLYRKYALISTSGTGKHPVKHVSRVALGYDRDLDRKFEDYLGPGENDELVKLLEDY